LTALADPAKDKNMAPISASRRRLVTGAATLLAAPAFIRQANAAATLKIATSFPNDPKFSAARIWYDLFVVRLKAATDGQVTTAFYPDNQLGQEADVVNQVKLGVVDAMLVVRFTMLCCSALVMSQQDSACS
jgi:TRAP-type transport system periplasmic protein